MFSSEGAHHGERTRGCQERLQASRPSRAESVGRYQPIGRVSSGLALSSASAAFALAGSYACASTSSTEATGRDGGAPREAVTAAPTAPPTPPASGPDAGADGATPGADADGDGVDDALEAKVAADYLPFLSVHPGDKCKTHGLLSRVSPHPTEPKRLMMRVVALFEKDCGLNGHSGDDETFRGVIEPARAAPAGILAVRAGSHQNTPCERITTCGACSGMTACSTAPRGGLQIPVVYASKDKHGAYSVLATCSDLICDFGGCELSTTPDTAPLLNVGEPGKPLVVSVTPDGVITAANGWTEPTLMNFDPCARDARCQGCACSVRAIGAAFENENVSRGEPRETSS